MIFYENISETAVSAGESILDFMGADDDTDGTNSTTASDNNEEASDGVVASTYSLGQYPTAVFTPGTSIYLYKRT